MNNTKIEVNGYELDLKKGFGFGLNYAIDDVRKPEVKNSNYSKTITLVDSPSNNKLMGGLFDINSDFTFFNPNKKTPAKIVIDSSTVIDGFIQLKGITELPTGGVEYRCTIGSKVLDFFGEIKGKKLKELDFTNLAHPYTYSSVSDSWNNTSKDTFVYPMPFNSSNTIPTNDWKPAIFHKAYLDKIAANVGYKLSGSLMDVSTSEGAAYAKDIIPFHGEAPIVLNAAQLTFRSFDAKMSVNTVVLSDTITNTLNPLTITPVTIPFDTEGLTTGYNTSELVNFSTGKHKVLSGGNYVYTSSLVFDLEFSTSNIEAFQQTESSGIITQNGSYTYNFNVAIYKNGVAFHYAVMQTKEVPFAANGVSSFNAANSFKQTTSLSNILTSNPISVIEGDIIEMKVSLLDSNVDTLQYQTTSSGGINVPVNLDVIIRADKFFRNIPVNTAIGDNGTIFLNDYIDKKAKQTDLLVDLIKRYNAYITIDPNNDRNIIIDTREAYYSKGVVLDWTDKKDFNSNDDVKFLSELQKKEFLFTYSPDEDIQNKLYSISNSGEVFGQKSIEFDNDFVKGSKKIETPFSPTPSIYNSDSPVAIVPALYNTLAQRENAGKGIRVLHYGGLISTIDGLPFTFLHDGINTSFEEYPYSGHLDNPYNPTLDLNFGSLVSNFGIEEQLTQTNANSFNRFWRDYISQISSGRMVTSKMNLNEVDIAFIRHNLNAKIFVDNSYYFINKIKDFNPIVKGLTTVEFLKIDSGVPFVSVTQVFDSGLN